MSLKEKLSLHTDPLYLMDGTAFIYRAFYAMQSMARSDGFPTNALYIVTRILMKILREEQPKYFAFIMDGKGPNFRHAAYPEYKANRSETPSALIQQLEPIKEAVRRLGIHVEVSDGCEADDCIASLARRYREERPVIILGMDKDLKQCLHEHVVMWDPGAKAEKVTTLHDFTAETGLTPEQWPDFQAIIGDSSDNIPGVPGVGPKTAEKIFAEYGTLEDIRENVAQLKPALQKKFDGQLENMFVYRSLTTLDTGTCMGLTLDDFVTRPIQGEHAAALLREYEMRGLLKELAGLAGEDSPVVPASGGGLLAFGKSAGQTTGRAAGAVSSGSAVKSASAGSQLTQGSLFDMGSTGPSAAKVYGVDDISAIPDCSGHRVAIVPAPETGSLSPDNTTFSVAVAFNGKEYLFTGAPSALAGHLTKAEQVVCPDVKALFRTRTGWRAIPMERWFDLGLAAYLLNPEERDYTWRKLSRKADELGVSVENHALLALAIAEQFTTQLEQQALLPLMRELELPLIPVLAGMEECGIRIDRDAFTGFLVEVQKELDSLTQRIYRHAGGEFNIRSSRQLGELLFDTLGLKSKSKTKGGQASTSQTVLEKLAGEHEVIDLILEYRKLEKLRSTYLEPLPKLADSEERIHTTFNQLATATGRLSSSAPNLQNIPVRGKFGSRMRACFTAAAGNVLISADYSQVELRVLAHCSQDPTLLDAFTNDQDIHSRTAALLFDKEQQQVSADERRNAKTINFGLVYGMGPQKLAQELKISLKDAKAFIERYFSRLQGLKAFYDQVEADAKHHMYVSTLTGRRRQLPDIHSQNNQLQSQSRRQAINTVIQGSAADIIKIAMLRAATDAELHTLGARLVLQVHDELLLEAPAEHAETAAKRLAAIMAGVAPGGKALDVPLKVDYGYGNNWAEAH